jgi:phosphatidylserine/phosphatidylglycerophosphate/cardiolipin synthase-like enzyme
VSEEGGKAGEGLSRVGTESLLQLSEALERGLIRAPLTPAALDHAGMGHLKATLSPLSALDAAAWRLLLDAVLAERRRLSQQKLDLVWSGTDAGVSYARYTKLVIPDLIESAKRQVTIAGYSFDQGAGVFEALHRAMVDRAVNVRFFLDIQQLEARLKQQMYTEKRRSRLGPLNAARASDPESYAREVLSLFLETHWPETGPKPELFYDPRTAGVGAYASLHAKCLVIDFERSLITSANFTDRGQSRNIEVGVLIHDRSYAEALERQWTNLVQSGDVTRG